MNYPKIIQNAAYVPQTDSYFISRHRHDFVQIPLGDGYHFIDGGNDYLRRSFMDSPVVKDWSLDEDSSWDDIRDKLLWGNRGKDGKSPLTYRPISEMSLEHIEAVLFNVTGLNTMYLSVFNYWRNYHRKYEDLN